MAVFIPERLTVSGLEYWRAARPGPQGQSRAGYFRVQADFRSGKPAPSPASKCLLDQKTPATTTSLARGVTALRCR
jgi:hypothetical protein